MKVALLSDCYLPRLGGIEVQVHELATRLRDSGHEVEVLTATPGRSGERHGAVEDVDGVRVHHLALRLPGDLPVNPLAPPELRRRLEAGGFDVAHVHLGVVSPFGWDAAEAALDVGLPTALTWHCVLDAMAPVLRATGRVASWSRRGAALSAVSRMAARPLAGLAPGAEITVLPNGVDLDRWRPDPALAEVDVPSPLTVVSAMRLAARKRPVPLVRVARQVEDLVGPAVGWRLDLFGDGPQRRLVDTAVRELGLTHRVRLRGRVPREELRAAYRSAAAYVSPVRLEAFGIAALEARAAGVPVLGMADSGVEEFVEHGVSGLLARGDRELARHVATMVTDPVVRQALRRHVVTVGPAQGWGRVIGLVEGEYARARSLRGRGSRA